MTVGHDVGCPGIHHGKNDPDGCCVGFQYVGRSVGSSEQKVGCHSQGYDGREVGRDVGCLDTQSVGVGFRDGLDLVGFAVRGVLEGRGVKVGILVGLYEGITDGSPVGVYDGPDGSAVGSKVGLRAGFIDGFSDGSAVGVNVGADGLTVGGRFDGLLVGTSVGKGTGVGVGTRVGLGVSLYVGL